MGEAFENPGPRDGVTTRLLPWNLRISAISALIDISDSILRS